MDIGESVRSQNEVALSLTKHVMATAAKNSNLVFSPLSMQVVLGLVAAGSGGATLDQLLSFLNFKSNDHLNTFLSELAGNIFFGDTHTGGLRLSFANGVWIDQSLSLKSSFKHVVENVYRAASNQVDFQTKAMEVTKEVNSWVEKETNGLIQEVLTPGSVDSSTRLIFANALYFKGAWTHEFDSSKTKEDDFHLLDGGSAKVPFMTSRRNQMVCTFDGFKVLRLPYKQGNNNNNEKRRVSMYMFLPDARNGLPALVEKMSSESGFLDRHLPNREIKMGAFKIPRFKISFGFEASQVLQELGLVLPFSNGGLTEMLDSSMAGQNLYVSEIFQKSFIEVNEEGTEATSTSVVTIRLCASMSVRTDFVADHPFLFLIREDVTGTVMFIGHVLNPLE